MRSTPCGPRSMRCASAMKPSSLRMRAISHFSRLPGTSTWSFRAPFALRMRVSMSAIVSVITPPIPASSPGSPAGLDHAGDLAPVRQLPQADAAEAELAKDRPRPAAAETPRVGAHLELGGPLPLLQQRLLGHPVLPPTLRRRRRLPQREAEQPQQFAGLLVRAGGGHDGDIHAANLLHLVVVDLGKDQLLLHAEVQVAAAIESPLGDSLEVFDPRQGHTEQLVQEVVHPVAAQGDLGPDGHPGAPLEVGDRLLRPRPPPPVRGGERGAPPGGAPLWPPFLEPRGRAGGPLAPALTLPHCAARPGP